MRGEQVTRLVAVALAAVAMACRAPARPATPDPLPPIPVYEITARPDTSVSVTRRTDVDPLAALGATRRVTVSANNADVRALLLWLAEEAGVSLVVAPDVRARITAHFRDVPAGEAIRAIIAESGLSVLTSAQRPNWPPVVFHQLPVNINEASAEAIVARFGVSGELAKWIVESRPRP